MTPSQTIIRDAFHTFVAKDASGRKLLLRRLTALDTLRLFKAAGPALSHNEPWLSMAGLAISVLEIDGIPVPAPTSEAQIEGLVERLGDEGLASISAALRTEAEVADVRSDVGNLPGTPS